MSRIFRDSESLGKSAGKKWSQNWTFLLGMGQKSPRKKKFFFCFWFCLILLGRTGVEPILLHVWSPKNGGGCRASIAPCVDSSCGRADACMCGRVNRPIYIYFFCCKHLVHLHSNIPKIYIWMFYMKVVFDQFIFVRIRFSSNRPTGLIRSSSRDVRLSVCLCVWCPFSCGIFWGLFCPHFPKLDVQNF